MRRKLWQELGAQGMVYLVVVVVALLVGFWQSSFWQELKPRAGITVPSISQPYYYNID